MPHRPIDPTELAEVRYHATAQRAVGCWWNALRFQPVLAAQIEREQPISSRRSRRSAKW